MVSLIDLYENRRTYDAMMKPLFDIMEILEPEFPDVSSTKTRAINDVVKLRKSLRRSDNIIWALKYLRAKYLAELSYYISAFERRHDDEQGIALKTMVDATTKSFLKSINKSTNTTNIDLNANIVNFPVDDFEHYGSYKNPSDENFIPKMSEFSFNGKSAAAVIASLDQIEDEWKDRQNRVLDYGQDEDAESYEVIVQFPDGSQWVNLHKPSCDLEGKAMGHCGNSYRSNPKFEVLSYRTPANKYGGAVKSNDTLHWVPHLTFILDTSNGNLIEAKGRNNNKPDHKYDRVITELLKLPLIKSIRYSGYKPENNFDPTQLPDDMKEELFAANPNLEKYAKPSWELTDPNDQFEALMNEFELYNIPMPENETLINGYKIQVYSEQASHIQIGSDIIETMISLYRVLDDDIDIDEIRDELVDDQPTVPNDTIWNALYDMSDEALQRLADEFSVSPNQRRVALIDDLIHVLKRSNVFSDLLEVQPVEMEYPATKDDVVEIINHMLGYASIGSFELEFDQERNTIDFYVTLDDMVRSMEEFIADDDYMDYPMIEMAKQSGSWAEFVYSELQSASDYVDETITSNLTTADAANDFERTIYSQMGEWSSDVNHNLAELFHINVDGVDSRDIRKILLDLVDLNENSDEFLDIINAIHESAIWSG